MPPPNADQNRRDRIEEVGAIAFGRGPDGKPVRGWKTLLSRGMGLNPGAVHDTLGVANSEVFDRKLLIYIQHLRKQMLEDIAKLDEIQGILAAADDNSFAHFKDDWKTD